MKSILLTIMAAPLLLGQQPCGELTSFKMAGAAITITKAEQVPAAAAGTVRVNPAAPNMVPVALPSYCRVDGVIDSRTGAGGKTYGIRFAVTLPDNWNSRFLFQGGGGLNGSVQMPLGAGAAGDNPGLARGYSVVTTDTGHQGAVFDGSFFEDQQASLDFYYVAIGRVAVVAKEIVARHYGRAPAHAYFVGCSTGGREAMIMSQRYPTYFDGIVSGDPAMRTGHSNVGLAYIEATYNAAAPKDDAGKPLPAQLFSDGDRKLIVGALLKACDEKDGVKDGMIFATKACDFDPAVLSCAGAKTESCLTPRQVAGLKKAFAGPKGVYPGFPYDAGIDDQSFIPGLLRKVVIPVAPPSLRTEYDAEKAAADLMADANSLLGDTTATKLSTFSGHGGKLMFYHGLSDPWFSPLDTLGYYEKMSRENGGLEKVQAWSRMYLVPGMGHCGGGSAALDQFDMLSAITDWVEKGAAPDQVVATGRSFPGRSRPLCAYPKHAQYSGQGEPNDAKNFACKE